MNNVLLTRLLDNLPTLNHTLRLHIVERTQAGRPTEALIALEQQTHDWEKTGAVAVLQVYLLHLAGEYKRANDLMDNLIGLNISEQLVMDNCPNEQALMSCWDTTSQGISVVCTTYNHARFIDMALAGFFSQVSTHPFEVIVRDDASTDGTSLILDRWAARYPRMLKVIRLNDNTYQKGIAPMPAALSHASYPLIAMCEGDDFWVDSNKLQLQADLLEKNPDWAAVTHNHFELDEAKAKLLPGRSVKTNGFLSKQDLMNVNLVLWVHTLMLRRSKLDLPEYSHMDGILGDQVVTATLGAAGSVYFVGNFFGSVARRNLASTYTPLSEAAKQNKRIQTRRFLAEVLRVRGEPQAAGRLQRWCAVAQQNYMPATN